MIVDFVKLWTSLIFDFFIFLFYRAPSLYKRLFIVLFIYCLYKFFFYI